MSPLSPPPPATMARPQGLVTTGARSHNEEQKPIEPDLRCWVKFVRGTPYNGEYGFDWMDWQRDPDPKNLNDWITQVQGLPIAEFTHFYDETVRDNKGKLTPQYVEVAKDAYLKRKLQSEYHRLTIYGEDYYAAWLSVRPGQEVKLQLAIEALNTDPVKDDYLTFAPHASYQVTVNGLVSEAIRLTPVAGSNAQNPQLVDVTIKCLTACADTTLNVLDENKTVVGQLRVVDNTKTYRLPLRVVYLVKDTTSAVDLGALKRTFAGLSLEQYLNEESLNQAQIQIEFENTNQVYEIIFKESEWASKFYDVANNWYTDYQAVDRAGKKTTTFFVDKVLSEYITLHEKKGLPPFRGLLVILTNIRKNPADDEGGVSKVIPVNYRATLVYGHNINSKSSYVHEIGHALGLKHSFLDAVDNLKIMEYIVSIAAVKENIDIHKSNKRNVYPVNIRNYQAYLRRLQENDRRKELAEAKIEEQRKLSRENDQKQIKAEKQLAELEKNLATYASNPYKFTKGTTFNIMDYRATTNSFFCWQWDVMQKDIVQYYGKAE